MATSSKSILSLGVFLMVASLNAHADVLPTIVVADWTALTSAATTLAGGGTIRINGELQKPNGADLYIGEKVRLDFSIPDSHIDLNTQSGTLTIDGPIVAHWSQQIFDSAEIGQVRGLMGGSERYPEWWGARASAWLAGNGAALSTKAIQCAIRSWQGTNDDAWTDFKVVFHGGTYLVDDTIDCRSTTGVQLIGQGPNGTRIWAKPSQNWASKKITTDEFSSGSAHGITGTAPVFLFGGVGGSGSPAGNSFSSGMRDMAIVMEENEGTALSGVITYWMEEQTFFERVSISGFRGYGLASVRRSDIPGYVPVINGLRMSHLYITGPRSPYAIAVDIAGTAWTLENSTFIGYTAGQSLGSQNWGKIGLKLAGNGTARSLHLEHWETGIEVFKQYGGYYNNIDLSAIEAMWLKNAAISIIGYYPKVNMRNIQCSWLESNLGVCVNDVTRGKTSTAALPFSSSNPHGPTTYLGWYSRVGGFGSDPITTSDPSLN